MSEAGERVYLSPPHLTGGERERLEAALNSGWIAPLGPEVDAFEREFAEAVGAPHAVALASGTAALHLALIVGGLEAGDEVLVSSMTFAASVNPIVYIGAKPTLIDSERESWNLDPALVRETLRKRTRAGRRVRAVVAVHLYGQCADIEPIRAACDEHGAALIEDAAEALGATHDAGAPGTFGQTGVFSFNGNKIITTSGGGMLVTADAGLAAHARKLATQAREPAAHYEHEEIGYNYRLSNLLAAVGRAQLASLERRVLARRKIFERYVAALGNLPVTFMPEAPWGRSSRWLTCLLIDHDSGVTPEDVRVALEAENIEARPLWKPMHLQPVFRGLDVIGGDVADDLFARGLCLPSGSNLDEATQDRVIAIVKAVFGEVG